MQCAQKLMRGYQTLTLCHFFYEKEEVLDFEYYDLSFVKIRRPLVKLLRYAILDGCTISKSKGIPWLVEAPTFWRGKWFQCESVQLVVGYGKWRRPVARTRLYCYASFLT